MGSPCTTGPAPTRVQPAGHSSCWANLSIGPANAFGRVRGGGSTCPDPGECTTEAAAAKSIAASMPRREAHVRPKRATLRRREEKAPRKGATPVSKQSFLSRLSQFTLRPASLINQRHTMHASLLRLCSAAGDRCRWRPATSRCRPAMDVEFRSSRVATWLVPSPSRDCFGNQQMTDVPASAADVCGLSSVGAKARAASTRASTPPSAKPPSAWIPGA